MSKVTMQDIANALSTSRISVWKALNNRPGISETLRRQVIDKSDELGYRRLDVPEAEHTQTQTVSVVIARPESSLFWMKIVHQIARELSKKGINLMYTSMPTNYQEGYTLPAALTDGSVDGIMVLNIYSGPILCMLGGLEIPKVFLDTVTDVPCRDLHGDVVFIEGRSLVREITARVLGTGRSRLGFVGDVRYAQTNMDRYHGFLDAHAALGLQPDPAFSRTGPLGLRTHFEELSAFLDSLPQMPDAFICASDFIAHFLRQYFEEKQISGVLLTGFDNNNEYLNIAQSITTVNVQTHRMGTRLVDKLMFRMRYPDASDEVSYIFSDILFSQELRAAAPSAGKQR
ncbi:MAG TPA: LacI family DNA-binding transcriptional regulator [Candidatus Limiplasma sp.]|nr:LacI family DNA-binding transcriptional regulator [Candidatus Limiplasma sp.]